MIDPLYLFVFAGLFSPGPNIILLTASGAQFGFRATVPHVLGVAAGVGVIAAVTGLGVGGVLAAFPALSLTLKIIAALWILWMAWRLARRARLRLPGGDRPFTFVQAVLFQWVNPKVWAVALAASAGYPAGTGPVAEAARLAIAFSTINLGVCLFWSAAGSFLSMLLSSDRAWAIFMGGMSLALAGSALMVFL